jgi:histidinol-phosphate aminotransferase
VKQVLLHKELDHQHKTLAQAGFTEKNLVLGNGSEELLMLATRAFAQENDTVVYSQHSFIIYKLASQSIGAKQIEVASRTLDLTHDLDQMAQLVNEHQAKIVYITNPNNPTGTYHNPEKIALFLEKIPTNTLVVLDEAYIEYVEDEFSTQKHITTWLQQYPNLLILRTCSKAYGLAGLRVGYGISSEYVINQINRLRQSFNCNVLAQKAAVIALQDHQFLQETVHLNSSEKQKLYDFFEQKEINISYIPSSTNFILLKLNKKLIDKYGTGKNFCDALLTKGLIIRPMTMYGLDYYVRLSIGTTEENICAQIIIKNML